MAAGDATRTIAVRKRERELAETYANWETSRLIEGLAQGQSLYEPIALEAMQRELESRQCPKCGLKRSKEALRCVCGHEFMPPLPPEPPLEGEELLAEIRARWNAEATSVPWTESRQLHTHAYLTVTAGAAAIFVAIITPDFYVLFASALAIGSAGIVSRWLKVHPGYSGERSARSKARSGRILGWAGAGLYVLGWFAPQFSVLGR